MTSSTQASISRRTEVLDACVFVGSVLIAIALGALFLVAGSPQYFGGNFSKVPSFPLSAVQVIGRACAIGFPLTLLYGVPLFISARRRMKSPLWMLCLSPLIGVLPGLAILSFGLLVHTDWTVPIFGIYLCVAGVWSALFGLGIYLALRKVEIVPIIAGAGVVATAIVGLLV